MLGALSQATARRDLDPEWQASFASQTLFFDFPLTSNQRVERLDHNLCSFGMFAVSAQTPLEAEDKADKLLERIEDAIGIPLCR